MKQFIIIGNSAAGISAIEAIRKTDQESKILVLSDEDQPSYCRCLISYYLAGDVKKEKILYRDWDFYKTNNVQLILNKKAARVEPKKNRIVCEDKAQLSYDALLIATGAAPKIPQDLKGIKKEGVFGLRTLKDVAGIEAVLPFTKAACVLGGGLVGLKAAYALKKRKIDVKVIIKSKQVLSQVLDFDAAALVQKRLEENGIEVILGQDVAEIIGEGDIRAVKLDSGKAIAASMVVVGKGVTANLDLIKESEIKFNEGIIAGNLLETNIANIYAAGDVCESLDLTLGRNCVNALWPVAVKQGRVAGTNMCGGNTVYEGSLGMNSLEFFGLPTISLGIYSGKAADGYEEIKLKDYGRNFYKKLVFKDNRLVGAVLVGSINNSGVFLRLIRERIDVSPFKDSMLDETFGYPDIMKYIKDKEKVYV